MEDLQDRINKLIDMSPAVREFVLCSKWDGIDESDSSGESDYESNFESKVYSFLVSEMELIGILFHDPTEMCTEGGMRSVVLSLYQLFTKENFLSFLSSLPTLTVDSLSQIIHSDEINNDEMLQRIIYFLHIELPTNQDLSLINHYEDRIFSNDVFTSFMENLLSTFRVSNKPSLSNFISDSEIDDYVLYIKQHREDVKFIVNQMIHKTNYVFDLEKINGLIEQHDSDLLSEANLNALAVDKSIFGYSNYHEYSKHPAIDLFHNHKISSVHHAEYYTTRHIHVIIDDQLDISVLLLMIADVFSPGMNLEKFKQQVLIVMNELLINEEDHDKLVTLLSVVAQLP